MGIDKQNARILAEELDLVVAEVLERFGLKAQPHRVTYGSTFTYKIEAIRPQLDESGFDRGTPEASAWLALGDYEIQRFYNCYTDDNPAPFKASDVLGAEFTSNGRRFRFAGMNPRGKRFLFLAEEIGTGKTYKFTDACLRAIKWEREGSR